MGYKYINTDDSHLHTYGGKPLFGTSTISKVATFIPPYYYSRMALEPLGWTPTKTKKSERLKSAKDVFDKLCSTTTSEEYLELLDKCYHNHKKSLDKSASKGIDLHFILETYIKDRMKLIPATNEYPLQINPFVEWANKNVKKWLASEFHVFSASLWCGGIVDALCILNDDTIALVDFKSAKEAYLAHFFQGAGYVLELEENGIFDSEGNYLLEQKKLSRNVDKIIIFPFGKTPLEPHYNTIPLNELKQGFKDCLSLYKLMNNVKWDNRF